MTSSHVGQDDVIVIGGGHNGLTCACYLAAAGLRVRVLERRHVVGGAAVTEEFFPGFRNSVAAYTVSLLHPKVIHDLRLQERGLRIVERPYANFVPLSDNRCFEYGGSLARTRERLGAFSRRDAEALPQFHERLDAAAQFVRSLLLRAPPNVDGGIADMVEAVKQGWRFVRLDPRGRRAVLDFLCKSVGDLLDTWFESDAVKVPFGFDAMVGSFASPYAPGSGYVLLHHVLGEINGKKGAWGHAIGGMGAITQAMAQEASSRGVVIETDAAVARIAVRAKRAAGVVLADGRELTARCVVANVTPPVLYLDLLEASHLDAEFLRRIRAYRCGSASFRMNVALSALPDFRCKPGREAAPHHSAGILIAPSLTYMEQAYLEARQLGWARQPIVEMLIPSTVDDTLAPHGAHVASLFCQHFNPQLPGGESWDAQRETAADLIIDTVDQYAPNFKRSILARQILSPLDLERIFGLTAGDIFHGQLGLDQIYSLRPIPGYADYRTPIASLYLCGAGAHPGGGVTGIPGHNAARRILRDLRGWRRD